MKLSNEVYDVLKWVALVVLPGLATFYFAIAGIWGLPFGDQVAATAVALEVLLGGLLGVSTVKYNTAKKLR